MDNQAVIDYSNKLKQLGIANQILDHPFASTKEEVLKFLNINLINCIPTIVMKADDKFIAIIIRGDTKIDFKKVKKLLGIKNLRLATPEEFSNLTNLSIGAARVYIPEVTTTLIDNKVFEKDYLIGGSGSFNSSINYKTSDLAKLPNSISTDIS